MITNKIKKTDPDKKFRSVLAASTLAGDSVRNAAGEDLGTIDEIMWGTLTRATPLKYRPAASTTIIDDKQASATSILIDFRFEYLLIIRNTKLNMTKGGIYTMKPLVKKLWSLGKGRLRVSR